MHKEYQVKIARKDQTLRKHSDIIKKLFVKYKDLCSELSIEPKISVKENDAGFVDVVLVAFFYFLSSSLRTRSCEKRLERSREKQRELLTKSSGSTIIREDSGRRLKPRIYQTTNSGEKSKSSSTSRSKRKLM
jgi:hypothetical protein